MDKDTLISANQVSFSYNNAELILDKITLKIKRGDFLGLIGPNGSGKTTLLKIMLGLLKPEKGEISLFGQPLNLFKMWHKIGYVPQKAGSIPMQFPISVEEVVGMAGGSKTNIIDALRAVNMESESKNLLTELSGGQQQRVFIAKALVSNPKLLILDEPTVGVDVESQLKFYELLRRLNQNYQLTLVLVSHDISAVAHEVKTIACINKTLIFHGKPKDVIKGDFMEKVYGKHLRFVVHGHY